MESVSEHLLSALDELVIDQQKRFKWRLKNHKGFSAADLEKADAPDTVDLMMKRFRPEEAVKITVDILRKMNLNQVAEELESKHEQAQADSSIEHPALPGTEVNPTEDTSTNIDLWTRKDFLQYSHQLTLDPNTAHKSLHLSEGSRGFTVPGTDQRYPDHPDRFDYYPQVLCRESVSGRCYWEQEWSCDEYGSVCISVSYKSISRKGAGDECGFGFNDQSWNLICSPNDFIFRHKKYRVILCVVFISSRIGVYVDFRAGTLSFYSVNRDTMSLIHSVQTTFTQPLYPGFASTYFRSSLKLC